MIHAHTSVRHEVPRFSVDQFMSQHPALTMLGVWGLCAAAFFILPFELLERPLAWQGVLALGAFMGAFFLGAAIVPTAKQRSLAGPTTTVDASTAERLLMLAATAAIVLLLMDLQDKNPFDLAAASESRSESADALLKGDSSTSSIWFQMAFLLYPASYVFMATHVLYAQRVLVWKLGLFGFLPVVLATGSMGGRMPIFYAVLVAGLAWRERSKFRDGPPSAISAVSSRTASPAGHSMSSRSEAGTLGLKCDGAANVAAPGVRQSPPEVGNPLGGQVRTSPGVSIGGWLRRLFADLGRAMGAGNTSAVLSMVRVPVAQAPGRPGQCLVSLSARAAQPGQRRWLIILLWLAFLGALLFYFVAVFSTRAAVVGGSAEMFSVAENLWGVGFRGPYSDVIFSLLGDEIAYLVFIFSWYVVQGVVMSNYLFSCYDGPAQLGVYGVDLISGVMRRLDPQGVSDGFDSLLALGTYGFFPSAWGSLYVDFGYSALFFCIIWGAFAALCYRRIVLQRRQDWLVVGPFVTIGIVCSTINTPLGFTNGFVTHAWLAVAFLLLRVTWPKSASKPATCREY